MKDAFIHIPSHIIIEKYETDENLIKAFQSPHPEFFLLTLPGNPFSQRPLQHLANSGLGKGIDAVDLRGRLEGGGSGQHEVDYPFLMGDGGRA